jgi:hypothetical protein
MIIDLFFKEEQKINEVLKTRPFLAHFISTLANTFSSHQVHNLIHANEYNLASKIIQLILSANFISSI